MDIHLYQYIMYICCRFKRKTKNGSPGDFPWSSKRKLVVCPFVYEEANGTSIYLLTYRLNGLNGIYRLPIYGDRSVSTGQPEGQSA